MNIVFSFMSMAFPKAGYQLGTVPLTFSTLLLIFVVFRNISYIIPALKSIPGLFTCYILLAVSCVFVLLGNWDVISAYEACQVLVVMASPLAIVAGSRVKPSIGCKIVCISLIIVCVYAVTQKSFGIVKSAIPGLTYTYGQSLTTKAIGYGMSSTQEAIKMPSTYQNGNGYGLFISASIPLLIIWQPETERWKRIKYISILSGFIGMLLCGSRSIMFPFFLMFLPILYDYQKGLTLKQRKLFQNAVIFSAFFGILYLVLFQSGMLISAYERYIVQTINDKTGSGRTVQWANTSQIILNYTPLQILRFVLIGEKRGMPGGGEGLYEFLFRFGVPATIGLFGCLSTCIRQCWKKARPMAFGLLCILIAFCVDQSYYYPPALINFFIIAVLALRITEEKLNYVTAGDRVQNRYVSKYIKKWVLT